jgi:hypothetical protein
MEAGGTPEKLVEAARKAVNARCTKLHDAHRSQGGLHWLRFVTT